MDAARGAADFLQALDWHSAIAVFWFMVLLEIPRFALGFLVAGVDHVAATLYPPPPRSKADERTLSRLKVSVVVAGHNEAHAMRACIRSLREQTRRIDEIICVDDGSTDGMREVLAQLRAEGLIDAALCNQDRCGKVSAANFGMMMATGDIVINLDADCSYDRDAIELLLEPFADPQVGAVCGAIGVRNHTYSVVTAYQAIEYIISIGLGKRVQDLFGIVTCVSGAFGAFRRECFRQIGGNEPGPGEDFDMTMRVRRAGWKIRYAADAWCFTDGVPTLRGLIRQRRRWDRDTIRIRLRKFGSSFAPTGRSWNTLETVEQVEFVVFNLIPTLVFPIYVGALFYVFGTAAFYILGAVAIVYVLMDIFIFFLAVFVTGRFGAKTVFELLPFLLTSGLFNGMFLRLVRLYAYFEEWVFDASKDDSYQPSRVRSILPYARGKS
ncbi:glycosyltransferase [Stappia sp. GBMRC 2046]|uniref:Glycosyltransferase n=1 Tax=Stappia sediminis TaxID=2692190 RepID=A0A7X3LQN9_9HYPH|nr:glycosyltransferase [Stappia sediminis]MXN63327.1 glycosyltransferase [Stappia sediminis]